MLFPRSDGEAAGAKVDSAVPAAETRQSADTVLCLDDRRFERHFQELSARLANFEQQLEVWNAEQRQRLEQVLRQQPSTSAELHSSLEQRIEELLQRLRRSPWRPDPLVSAARTRGGAGSGPSIPKVSGRPLIRPLRGDDGAEREGTQDHASNAQEEHALARSSMVGRAARARQTAMAAQRARGIDTKPKLNSNAEQIDPEPAAHDDEDEVLSPADVQIVPTGGSSDGVLSPADVQIVPTGGSSDDEVDEDGFSRSVNSAEPVEGKSDQQDAFAARREKRQSIQQQYAPGLDEPRSSAVQRSLNSVGEELRSMVRAAKSAKMSSKGSTIETTFLMQVIEYPAFDYFFASLIMLNSIFIGVQTEYRIANLGIEEEHIFFVAAEYVFAGFFLAELVIRLAAQKLDFFRSKGCHWNWFDLVLVCMSLIEIFLEAHSTLSGSDKQESSGASGSAGKVIRMFRMARICRVLRVLRFLAELRVMVTLIIHSMRSLFWLMILLLIILYVFSIIFTQGVTEFLTLCISDGSQEGCHHRNMLLKWYGSGAYTAYTLFCTITNGVSWYQVVEPLSFTGVQYVALYVVYVFFCVFSVLNIVTGVFVDGAIQRSNQERDLRLEKEREQKEMYVTMLLDLLEDIDADGKGAITRVELEEAFKDERVRHYFSVLDIDIADSNYLFNMLDLDDSGEVDMEEFVSGCLRLKGNAKSIDVHTLMFEIKNIMRKWEVVMDAQLKEVQQHHQERRGSAISCGSRQVSPGHDR